MTALEHGTVRIEPWGRVFAVRPGESVVEAIRRAGFRVPYRCRRGGCGTCVADVVSGHYEYQALVSEDVLSQADRGEGAVLPCRAMPLGDLVLHLRKDARLESIFGPAADLVSTDSESARGEVGNSSNRERPPARDSDSL